MAEDKPEIEKPEIEKKHNTLIGTWSFEPYTVHASKEFPSNRFKGKQWSAVRKIEIPQAEDLTIHLIESKWGYNKSSVSPSISASSVKEPLSIWLFNPESKVIDLLEPIENNDLVGSQVHRLAETSFILVHHTLDQSEVISGQYPYAYAYDMKSHHFQPTSTTGASPNSVHISSSLYFPSHKRFIKGIRIAILRADEIHIEPVDVTELITVAKIFDKDAKENLIEKHQPKKYHMNILSTERSVDKVS